MSDYPIPHYAAHIWVAGDTLWLGFPGTAEGVREHSVPFPITDKSIALVVETLRARERNRNWLGTKGAPTRYDVKKELQHDKKYNTLLRALRENKNKKEAEKAEAEAFLEELGL